MNIDIPIPVNAIGTIVTDPKTGENTVIATREWYRFWTTLRQAVFGDTNGVDGEILAVSPTPLSYTASLEARIAALESLVQGREEFPYRRIADLEMLSSRSPG